MLPFSIILLLDYNKFKETFEKAAATNAALKEKIPKKEAEEKKQA